MGGRANVGTEATKTGKQKTTRIQKLGKGEQGQGRAQKKPNRGGLRNEDKEPEGP